MLVNVLDAKNRLSQLIRQVRAGEEVVIANRGTPVARLTAVDPRSPCSGTAGSAAEILAWLGEHPLPPYAKRTAADIDAGILEERRGWD